MGADIYEVCKISYDPDEIEEIGNNLIGVQLLLKPLKEKVIEKYGTGIINFSRKLL